MKNMPVGGTEYKSAYICAQTGTLCTDKPRYQVGRLAGCDGSVCEGLVVQ